jgi:predicted transport protein
MADIQLYNIKNKAAKPCSPLNVKYEREMQGLCERNLEVFFGIRFLATEYPTTSQHRGRIDTLGLDENDCPVIIEYKLNTDQNVINQGLFYLDWLMDHKANFEQLCESKLGKKVVVDWSNPRLLCIAKDFSHYDDHAIQQIDRNIELIRYRRFEEDLIAFEQAAAVQQVKGANGSAIKYREMDDIITAASKELLALYQGLEDHIFSLGDDIQKKELKYYHAFSRIRNFVCAEIRTRDEKILLYLKVKYESIELPGKNIRDVGKTGHYGTGDTEITIKKLDELDAIKHLIEASYNNS